MKFFPLFFSKKLMMSPIGTNSIYIAVPIFTSWFLIAQRPSMKVGRVSQYHGHTSVFGSIGMWIPAGCQ